MRTSRIPMRLLFSTGASVRCLSVCSNGWEILLHVSNEGHGQLRRATAFPRHRPELTAGGPLKPALALSGAEQQRARVALRRAPAFSPSTPTQSPPAAPYPASATSAASASVARE